MILLLFPCFKYHSEPLKSGKICDARCPRVLGKLSLVKTPRILKRWHQLAFESSALSLPGVVRGGCTQLGTLGTCVVSTE